MMLDVSWRLINFRVKSGREEGWEGELVVARGKQQERFRDMSRSLKRRSRMFIST